MPPQPPRNKRDEKVLFDSLVCQFIDSFIWN
jgi:hypothetical protein